MKFLYRYQDRERGVLEGEIAAPSESDAYTALRKSGVRPMKVWLKPGIVNRLSGISKRWIAILVLGALCLVLGVILLSDSQSQAPNPQSPDSALSSLPRKQCDPVDVAFGFRSEAILARFARPGELVEGVDAAAFASDIHAALKTALAISDADSPAAVELKRIVIGLKNEVRIALASGEKPETVLARFVERQRMEAEYRKGIVESLREVRSDEQLDRRIESANKTLRLTSLREIQKSEIRP